jgi:hypothetical protein
MVQQIIEVYICIIKHGKINEFISVVDGSIFLSSDVEAINLPVRHDNLLMFRNYMGNY